MTERRSEVELEREDLMHTTLKRAAGIARICQTVSGSAGRVQPSLTNPMLTRARRAHNSVSDQGHRGTTSTTDRSPAVHHDGF